MGRIWQNHAFRVHLIIYAVVNVLLVILNLATSPDKLWFYWPLIGWGVGILAHAFGIYRRTSQPHARASAVRGRHR